MRLREYSFADWKAIIVGGGKNLIKNHGTVLASAVAYSSFLAIPSVLIVATGVFTLIAEPQTITTLTEHLHGLIPEQATALVNDSLRRVDAHSGTSLAVTIFGFVVAVWAVTGAMNTYMLALTAAYERKDRRSFLRRRIVAIKMAAVIGGAIALVAVLTIFGPQVERSISSRSGPAGGVLDIVWWILQWPIELGGLLVAFATLLYLGPDVEQPKWEFLTPGSLVAAVLWIAASGLFAVYTSSFASYNRTWGTLSAVIVTLTWLWITGLALLLGAEINAEAERRWKAPDRIRTDD